MRTRKPNHLIGRDAESHWNARGAWAQKRATAQLDNMKLKRFRNMFVKRMRRGDDGYSDGCNVKMLRVVDRHIEYVCRIAPARESAWAAAGL